MTLNRRLILSAAVLGALGLALLPGVASAAPRSFELINMGSSRVTFESDAPIEDIVGVTTSVTGTLGADLEAPTAGAKATVVVDLTTLKTGVDKRDEHMRSADFLDTARFPTATFELTRIEIKGDPRQAGGATGTAYGKLTLKGNTKEIALPVKVAFRKLDDQLKKLGLTGDVLRVTGGFSIQLSDYGIHVPSKLGAKVSNTVDIKLALTGVAK